MKTKTAYRPKVEPAEISAPSVPVDDEKIQPSESVRINFDTKAEPGAAIEPPPPVDETTQALKQQIEHLRTSEELQRRHAQQMAQRQQAQPPTREQKLSMWIQQGLDEEDGRFLSEHPEMIDRHDVTRIASDEAEQQGHRRGSDAHRLATKENFDRHLGQQQPRPAASAEPAPAFFAASPTRAAPPDRSSMYSAPPSRQAPSTGYRVPSSPSQVRLSPAEVEIARASGVTERQYAEGKLRLMRAKANGELQ